MRIARLRTPDGLVTGSYADGVVTTPDEEAVVGEDGHLTYPCSPSAVYCVGRNYAETLSQMEYDRPDEPDFFIKPPTALTGPDQPIYYPEWTEELTYAGELAAVIDEQCHEISPEDVPAVVRGYTILNDVDALDQPGRTARKAFDTSGPLGPFIETDIDPYGIEMETIINGAQCQSATTDQMLFDPYYIISFLSERVTFQPGDIVAFGSPANPGTITPGDTIKITYDGIGTLCNTVVSSR